VFVHWCCSQLDLISSFSVLYLYLCVLLTNGSSGQFPPSVWPHNPSTRFRPPSATVVSSELFSSRNRDTAVSAEGNSDLQAAVSLWWDPDDVPHCRILSPDKTEWRLISATLWGWSRCFVADQLWFMTRIREEEVLTWFVRVSWFTDKTFTFEEASGPNSRIYRCNLCGYHSVSL